MLWGLWCLKLTAGFLDCIGIIYDHGFILMPCFLKLYISSDVTVKFFQWDMPPFEREVKC
jgi:hypothetical protein